MVKHRAATPNSESVDDYLKAIFALGDGGTRRIGSKELADRLNVAMASVTNMIQKLASAKNPLVDYERHRGASLSRRAQASPRNHSPPPPDRNFPLRGPQLSHREDPRRSRAPRALHLRRLRGPHRRQTRQPPVRPPRPLYPRPRRHYANQTPCRLQLRISDRSRLAQLSSRREAERPDLA